MSLTGSTVSSTGGIELPLTIINYIEDEDIDIDEICALHLVIAAALGESISEFIMHYENVCP